MAPYRHPCPILDAQRAIRLVRHRAREWRIDPEHMAILGFSASGHLVAIAGTQFGTAWLPPRDGIDAEDARPDALILCYPVISFQEYRHDGSMRNLLGEESAPELRDLLSAARRVTAETPPTFLWHTATDQSVPVENSLLFAEALSRHKVPFELHIFPEGRHGLGIKDEVPHVTIWMRLCEKWLREMGF